MRHKWYVVTNSNNYYDNVTKYENDENKSDENKSDENENDENKNNKNKSCEQRTFADPSYFTTGKTTLILRTIIFIISTD